MMRQIFSLIFDSSKGDDASASNRFVFENHGPLKWSCEKSCESGVVFSVVFDLFACSVTGSLIVGWCATNFKQVKAYGVIDSDDEDMFRSLQDAHDNLQILTPLVIRPHGR
jgi:hypothetical protein